MSDTGGRAKRGPNKVQQGTTLYFGVWFKVARLLVMNVAKSSSRQRFSVVPDVPREATGIFFGGLSGSGAVGSTMSSLRV